jgi:hypothetical protein
VESKNICSHSASCDFRYHGDSNDVMPGTDDSVWEIITKELNGFSKYFVAQKSVAQSYNDGWISNKDFQTETDISGVPINCYVSRLIKIIRGMKKVLL